MLSFEGKRIHLACGDTDMRKSINGLAAKAEGDFKLDAYGAAAFVFCNRMREVCEVPEWDGSGFWLHLKQLERGRFRWPAAADEATMQLGFFDEAEATADLKAPEKEIEQITYKRKKRAGKREEDFSALPVETVVHELPENGQACPDCGEALHVMGKTSYEKSNKKEQMNGGKKWKINQA